MIVDILDLPPGASGKLEQSVRDSLGKAAFELGAGDGELALRFLALDQMHALNKQWRGKDRPTDVVSFPNGNQDPAGIRHLGDIAICLEIAQAQADDRGHSLERELSLLAVHGLLHLLGYDHETDDGEMEALEQRLWPIVLGPESDAG